MQHVRIGVLVNAGLLYELLLRRLILRGRRLAFPFFAIGQHELIPGFAEALQALLDEDYRREDIPAVNDELFAGFLADFSDNAVHELICQLVFGVDGIGICSVGPCRGTYAAAIAL